MSPSFTDPTFGILLPKQGSIVDEPELDHRSVCRVDPATKESAMAEFEQPNGVFLPPDRWTLYVFDTARSLGGWSSWTLMGRSS